MIRGLLPSRLRFRVWWALVPAGIFWLLPLPAQAAGRLRTLAEMDGVPGYEGLVADYVRRQLPIPAREDNTGSLTVTFGEGPPHTLIVAGLDEPGFVVSGFTPEGYLRLKTLAEPLPHYRFHASFLAQEVRIHTGSGPVAAVVAAPSVHLRTEKRVSASSYGEQRLYVDIGARHADELDAAGIRILDPVTLRKESFELGRSSRVSAPWISSRAGASVLIDLAHQFHKERPARKITLGFVAQQHYFHRGLARVLTRTSPDQVLVIQPGGETNPEIGAAQGWSSEFADGLIERAKKLGLAFRRGSSRGLDLGAFGRADFWPDPDQSAILTVGVEHAGTPVEVLDRVRLDELASLFRDLAGVPAKAETHPSEAPSTPTATSEVSRLHAPESLSALILGLAAINGVSEKESPVRKWIEDRLPPWAKRRAEADAKGNLIVRLGKKEPPEALFIAHMDEIGFRVTRVDREGLLRAESVGGLLEDLYGWQPVVVVGAQGPVHGIMLRPGEVDIGANSTEEAGEQGVQPGATVLPRKQPVTLRNGRIAMRSLDDRIGCAILLNALLSLDPEDLPALLDGAPTWLVFGVEEETGLHGAEALASRAQPTRLYPVDSFVTSDTPLEEKRYAHAPLGEGFVFRAVDSSGIAPRRAIERVAALAREFEIPFQVGITSGGNDGARFVPGGASSVPLSWPIRYSHTRMEVSDLADIRALERIVHLVIKREVEGMADAPP